MLLDEKTKEKFNRFWIESRQLRCVWLKNSPCTKKCALLIVDVCQVNKAVQFVEAFNYFTEKRLVVVSTWFYLYFRVIKPSLKLRFMTVSVNDHWKKPLKFREMMVLRKPRMIIHRKVSKSFFSFDNGGFVILKEAFFHDRFHFMPLVRARRAY